MTHCFRITIKSRSVLILQVVRTNCRSVFVRFSFVGYVNSEMFRTIVSLLTFIFFKVSLCFLDSGLFVASSNSQCL